MPPIEAIGPAIDDQDADALANHQDLVELVVFFQVVGANSSREQSVTRLIDRAGDRDRPRIAGRNAVDRS